MKKHLIFLLLPFLFSCKQKTNNETKAGYWNELDLKTFKISIPKIWHYKSQQGIDSFVGDILGPGVSFSFDFSGMGYANHLIDSEQEYLEGREWDVQCNFCKDKVVYNNKSPELNPKRSIHRPTKSQKKEYPKADYVADLTFKDSTIYVPIEIPQAIKEHNIKIDTTDKYIIKTIWPKTPGKGMVGVYYHSRSTALNFQINGQTKYKQDQDLALQAFKTIVIK